MKIAKSAAQLRATHTPAEPFPNKLEAIGHLYAVERQAGLSIQTNTLNTWIAAATYATAAATLLVLMAQGRLDEYHPLLWIVLPLPAWALANYHLILFFTGMAHAKSIKLLEAELVSFSGDSIAYAYNLLPGRIGARAETSLTEFAFAKVPMFATSIVAYLIPYVSVLGLAGYCAFEIWHHPDHAPWRYPVLALQALLTLSLVASAIFVPRKMNRAYRSPAPKS